MGLPPRVFYTLSEVTALWNCQLADLAGWAAAQRFDIVTALPATCVNGTTLAGFVAVSVTDILPMFRRCGTGPTTQPLRRVRPLDQADWVLLPPPPDAITVTLADLLMMAEAVHRFEAEHGLLRRPVATSGREPDYDWEGMMLALIQRIHDHGLPATQAELVAEMQAWFADQSNGKKMPDERSIRRRITPIWRALHREPA